MLVALKAEKLTMNLRRISISLARVLTFLSVTSFAFIGHAEVQTSKPKQACALFFKKVEGAKKADDVSIGLVSEKFEHFPPETNANRRPRYVGENLREIEVSKLAALKLPEGFDVRRIYQANAAGMSEEKIYQVVIGHGDRDAANISVYYDAKLKDLSVSTMETQSDFRGNHLGTALLKSVDLLTNGEAKSVQFSLAHTNNDNFIAGLDNGDSLEIAIGKTALGRSLRELGFRLEKVSVPKPIALQRRELMDDIHSDTRREAGTFYFWFSR